MNNTIAAFYHRVNRTWLESHEQEAALIWTAYVCVIASFLIDWLISGSLFEATIVGTPLGVIGVIAFTIAQYRTWNASAPEVER